MKTILIIGAGSSSSWLIDYMLEQGKSKWNIIVLDSSLSLIHEKINNHKNGVAAVANIEIEKERQKFIQKSDLVISLITNKYNQLIAYDCLDFKKHFICLSALPEEFKKHEKELKNANLLFMTEMAWGQGLQQMISTKIIRGIQKIAGRVTEYKSYIGSFPDDESDNNPWHYKLSLDIEDVILPGKTYSDNFGTLSNDVSTTLSNDVSTKTGYMDTHHKVHIKNLNSFSAVSIDNFFKARQLLADNSIGTIEGFTLWHPGFLKAWNLLIKAGLTDHKDTINAEELTLAEWVALKTGINHTPQLENAFKEKYNVDSKTMKTLKWLDIFENKLIYGKNISSSANILQHILENKWSMNVQDKDYAVIHIEVIYNRRGEKNKITSTMITKGKNKLHNAPSKVIGLPIGMLAKRILNGVVDLEQNSGIQNSNNADLCEPILKELVKYDVEFMEDFI